MESEKPKAIKYLTVQVLGKNGLRVNCFKNDQKKNPKAPDYRGDGIAIWINESKPQQKEDFVSASEVFV